MENRIQKLLSRLPEEVDAVLVTSVIGRRYFAGMHSTAGTLLAIKNVGAFFLIDFRYIEKARVTVRDCEVILQEKLHDQLTELMKRHGVKKLAVEGEYMTVSEFAAFKEKLPAVELVSDPRVDRAARDMRALKSPEELDSIRAAQKITDDAFTHICGYIKAGMTEKEIACELLDYTYRHGSEGPSFDYIVVSGKNSSMPHGNPSDKKVEAGDFITMDFGCLVNGYCSDMTRTVAVGKVSEEMEKVYNTVLEAQLAAIAAIRPGVSCRTVDAAARDIIRDAGYGDCFGHGTGHALGLEIHEPPAFNQIDETICVPGMVISAEPGIYLAGRFGVRTEDIVVVTETGCEDLTHSNKQLIVI